MGKKKVFLGLLMTLVLLVAAVPATALAETPDSVSGNDAREPVTYTITYDYNYDGKGTYTTETVEEGQMGTVIPDILNREGRIWDYVFAGWSTSRSASPESVELLPGVHFEVTGDMTLYAVWGENKWGETLHAKGYQSITSFVYDGNYHSIRGIEERPDNDRETVKGDSYRTGYFYQPLWYSLNVWRYTYFGNIQAGRVDVGRSTTPAQGQLYAEIWVPWPWDNEWVLVEDTYTQIIPATMEVTPASLTVTAEDMKVKYTGEEITPEGTLSGLVTPTNKEQETATLKMTPFTEVGVHPMTYTIVWDGTAKEGNYTVTEEKLGNLTIYYELTFDANGGEGAPEAMEVTENTVTLPAEEPTLEGYLFKGWAKSADAETADYQAGETIDISDNTVLYAVWETKARTITYTLDGGIYSGSAEDIVEIHNVGDEITIHEAPEREGYVFIEWSGSSYHPGDKYIVEDDHTFRATWMKEPEPTVAPPTPTVAPPTPSVAPPTPSVAPPTPSIAPPTPSIAPPTTIAPAASQAATTTPAATEAAKTTAAPATGDNSNAAGWIVIMCMAIAALVMTNSKIGRKVK